MPIVQSIASTSGSPECRAKVDAKRDACGLVSCCPWLSSLKVRKRPLVLVCFPSSTLNIPSSPSNFTTPRSSILTYLPYLILVAHSPSLDFLTTSSFVLPLVEQSRSDNSDSSATPVLFCTLIFSHISHLTRFLHLLPQHHPLPSRQLTRQTHNGTGSLTRSCTAPSNVLLRFAVPLHGSTWSLSS